MTPRRARLAAAPAPRQAPRLPCPCGGEGMKVIVPGNAAGIRPGYGPIAWPIPTRLFCSIACATLEGWPWLASEAGKPAGKLRPKTVKPHGL